MRNHLMGCGLLAVSLIGLGFTGAASAAKGGNNECPVELVNDQELDEEFGPETEALTRCLKRRHQVKVVMQINRFCRDNVSNAECADNRAYALGNIRNMIKDYEITHGMEQGKDYEIVAVVHSGGGWQMLKDEGYKGGGAWVTGRNKFEAQVSDLIAKGVKFYFCQNTTRSFVGKGILPAGDVMMGATGEMIDGVLFTTAGVTAIADFQSQGYTYVQP